MDVHTLLNADHLRALEVMEPTANSCFLKELSKLNLQLNQDGQDKVGTRVSGLLPDGVSAVQLRELWQRRSGEFRHTLRKKMQL